MRFFKAILLSLLFIAVGCKTNQMRNKLKEGRWVYTDTVDAIPYKSTGKYRKGIEKKTWHYYANNKLVKKEKYKHGICYTTTYFEDGKIASEGKTKIMISPTETHWCYYDDWFFYDQSGKLVKIKKYENGALLKETKMQ
jgi:antitoxin component YwqK of YwqJK toxin-antitoxin module